MFIIRKDQLKLVDPSDCLLKKKPEPYLFDKDGDPQYLINVLFDKMHEFGGIGLSANQVGMDKRMFVMSGDKSLAVFNPVILEYHTDTESFKEGCLTYPGLFLNITRPKSIKVKFQDKLGNNVFEEFIGLTARVFQHEYEHMEGKNFTENVSKLKLDLAKKRYDNLKKKIIKKHAVKTMINAINN